MSDQPKVRTGRGQLSVKVVPHREGWSVETAEAGVGKKRFASKAEAVKAAKELLRNRGGVLVVHSGKRLAQATFTLGRNAMEQINAVEGAYLTPKARKEFRNFDRLALSSEERRRTLAEKFGKRSG